MYSGCGNLITDEASAGSMKKLKRKRQMKTPSQLNTLERTYSMEMYPTKATRAELSVKLGLTDRQLQMWFCRKRLKVKEAAEILATKSPAPAKVARRGMTESPKGGLTMGAELGSNHGSGSGSRSNMDHAGMITYTKKESNNREELLLPDDLIAEILSWLPVEYVLRCKCVCKSWLSITRSTFFIEKHASRSKWQTVYEEKYVESNGHDETFRTHCYCRNGLVLDFSARFNKFRLRNPATKQVLEVPEDPLEVPTGWRYMDMYPNYKLICIHSKLDPLVYGIKILTVETDLSWRPLPITLVGGDGLTEVSIAYNECVFYIISLSFYNLEKTEILRLNMDDESFMKSKLPQGFESLISGRVAKDVFQMIVWDEKLTIGFLINGDLHLWVLESYEKQIWSEKKVIPLDFMKDHPNFNNAYKKYVIGASKGQLKFLTGNALLECDIRSKKVTCYSKALPPGKEIMYCLKPNLVSLKGMHSGGITPRLFIA